MFNYKRPPKCLSRNRHPPLLPTGLSVIRSLTCAHLVRQYFFFGDSSRCQRSFLKDLADPRRELQCSPTPSHIRSPPSTASPQEDEEHDHRVLSNGARASGLLTSVRVWKARLPCPVHLPRVLREAAADGGLQAGPPPLM